MKFRLLACVLLLVACEKKTARILIEGPDNSFQAETEILAADRAFNEEAKAKGTGPAFADFMDATDGILIEPGGEPIKGRDAIFAAQNDNTVPSPLVWEPAAAFAGKSGDFGASWGHWTLTGKRPDGTPTTATGKYLTVWRKNANGEWKGLMDTGVTDIRTPPATTPPVMPPGSDIKRPPESTLPGSQEPPEIIQPPGPGQPSAHP